MRDAAMEVSFVRVPKIECEGVVRFANGRVFSVPSPGGFREVPPHDLGQFIVEQTLGWQTGFWGYIARGVVFPSMEQTSGKHPPHGEERSRAAIRGAKDLLAEVEALAGAIASLARGHFDDDPDRVAGLLRKGWWPPHSKAAQLSLAEIRRACGAFRQVEHDWRALDVGDSMRFRWTLRRNPIAPENPLDLATAAKRRAV
jgi:hypothetical protein